MDGKTLSCIQIKTLRPGKVLPTSQLLIKRRSIYILHISGSGFKSLDGIAKVKMGNSDCTIKTVEYNQIVCETTSGNPGSVDVTVTISAAQVSFVLSFKYMRFD